MSVQLTTCNKCGSTKLKRIEVINPDTTNMNMKAKLKCEDCKHEDIYEVMSNHHKKQREMGYEI